MESPKAHNRKQSRSNVQGTNSNRRLFAPLSVPRERRLQTLAIFAWLCLFFGSIVILLFVVGVWFYLGFSTFTGVYTAVGAVFGDTAYYRTARDREELGPRFADHLGVSDYVIASEFVILTSLMVYFSRVWRRDPWNTAQRRYFPTRVFDGNFSPEHEFLTNTWTRRLAAAVYIRWSHYLTSYFPHRIIFDDTDIDEDAIHDYFPDNVNYIFGCHPHGMASVSFWSSFCWRPTRDWGEPSVAKSTIFQNADTPMRRFMEKYVVYGLDYGPPIGDKTAVEVATQKQKAYSLVIHTLDANFIQPFWRELILRLGLRDVCRRAILNSIAPVEADALPMADRRAKGHLSRISCIVVGGAAESIDHNRHGLLTLQKRKGFIRLCVETGACAVPVYAFGENDLYGGAAAKLKGDHWSVRLNRRCQKVLGFALPFARGRGMFNYFLGIIPHRKSLTTVIGKPIHVRQVERPKRGDADFTAKMVHFDSEVDRIHSQYIAALQALYRRHQPVLDPECPVKELQLR